MPSRKYLTRERALLVVVCVAAAAASVSSPLPLTVALALVVALLLTLHHGREVLLFAYLAVAALALVLLWDAFSWENRAMRRWLCVLASVGAAGGVVGSVAFPLPVDLSRVRGEYQTIGCVTMRLGGVDCRVFYPVARTPSHRDAKQRVPYVHHGQHLARALSFVGRAPQWFFQTLDAAYLAGIPDATIAEPAAKRGWPLVIFSHGLGGSLEIYAMIVQDLASRGNVVVILNHCDGSACVTRHDDGRYEQIQPVSRAVMDNTDGEGFRVRNRQLGIRVREVRHVLDTITELAAAQSHHIFRTVNLRDVHVAGHSFGAATALSAAHEDSRFRSAMLLDAYMMPVSKEHAVGLGDRLPVMHLMSEHFLVDRKDNTEAIKLHANGCTHPRTELLVLRGSHHNNFTDLPQFAPLITRLARLAGAIDPHYANYAIADLCAAFVSGERSVRDVQRRFPEIAHVE